MSAHGVIHILDSASGKARPLKLTSDKLGVNDSVAQASLSNIENFISGTLMVEDSVSQISLNNIDNSLTGTLNVQDSNAQSSLSNIDSSLSSTLNVQDSVSQNSLFNIESSALDDPVTQWQDYEEISIRANSICFLGHTETAAGEVIYRNTGHLGPVMYDGVQMSRKPGHYAPIRSLQSR